MQPQEAVVGSVQFLVKPDEVAVIVYSRYGGGNGVRHHDLGQRAADDFEAVDGAVRDLQRVVGAGEEAGGPVESNHLAGGIDAPHLGRGSARNIDGLIGELGESLRSKEEEQDTAVHGAPPVRPPFRCRAQSGVCPLRAADGVGTSGWQRLMSHFPCHRGSCYGARRCGSSSLLPKPRISSVVQYGVK